MARAVERECECIQIFTTSPRAWKHQTHPGEEAAAFREGIAARKIAPVVAHGSYLINLSSGQTHLRERSASLLAETCRWAGEFGCGTVVVHVGHCEDAKMAEGLGRAARILRRVLKDAPPSISISMEMTAGGRGSVGASFDHFRAILDEAGGSPRLTVWMDTAHAFEAGHDLRGKDGLAEMLGDLDRAVGIGRLAGVHANDSRTGFGSRVDRHENIGEGEIGAAGFRTMLRHPVLRKLPFILETPGFDDTGPDLRNVRILRKLGGGAGQ